MTPVHQAIIDNQRGDCFSACLASILDLPLATVPQFCAAAVDRGQPHEAFGDIIRWLDSCGLGLLILHPKSLCDYRGLPGVDFIARLPSQRFTDTTHAVVGSWRYHDPAQAAIGDWVEWFVAHDPNPGNQPYTDEVLRQAWGFCFLMPRDLGALTRR